MRTHRAQEHETGEGDNPEFLGVDKIATIELGRSWVRHLGEQRNIEQRTNQKSIS